MAEDKKTLYYLEELSDYKIASDDPDVRGWEVRDADNRVIGTVDNLLVNKRQERVVYLDVEVDESIIEANHDPYGTPSNSDVHEFINKEGENHIIIPVGLVQVNKDKEFVHTDTINHQTFAETKRKEKNTPVDREYETVVLDSYDRFGTKDKDHKSRKGNQRTSEKDFETKPDDTYDEDYRRSETRKKEEEYSRNRKFNEDDDTFYDRGEFENPDFRRKNRNP